MSLEQVLCSKTRIKILRALMKLSQLNVTATAELMRINYAASLKHLQILEHAHVLQRRDYGRSRLYRLINDSDRAKALCAVIEAWDNDSI